MTLHDLGLLLIGGAVAGLIVGPSAYHSGLTDGAKSILRQLKREAREARR